MTEIISISEQHNLTVKFLIDKYNFAYLRINVKKINLCHWQVWLINKTLTSFDRGLIQRLRIV
jgi:hypothetical protein